MSLIQSGELENLKDLLKNRLSKKRYQHSLGVAETAKKLALRYGCDAEKAYLAGLVHDYAKNMKDDVLIDLAQSHHLIFDSIELEMPKVLHATVGAWLLPQETVVNDVEVLQAVAFHTLGNVNMTLLDKIIFVADIVEPNRDMPHLSEERKLAFENLNIVILHSLEYNIYSSLKNNRLLHPMAVVLRNECLKNLSIV